jgi:hypothetical protein
MFAEFAGCHHIIGASDKVIRLAVKVAEPEHCNVDLRNLEQPRFETTVADLLKSLREMDGLIRLGHKVTFAEPGELEPVAFLDDRGGGDGSRALMNEETPAHILGRAAQVEAGSDPVEREDFHAVRG